MCGILLVKSSEPIDDSVHLQALELLEPRGPDFVTWRSGRGIFIGQTVLHLTGSDSVYKEETADFVAFNGEIYNYRDLGPFDSDTRYVKHIARHQYWQDVRQWQGPWAWAWTDFNQIMFATDPQMERHLFVYQDQRLLIVSSEIAPILHYVKLQAQKTNWVTKHWPILDRTPWPGIFRAEPGRLYINGTPGPWLDRMQDWYGAPFSGTFDEAVEELDSIMYDVCRDITPAGKATLSYSGGLDSSLIFDYQPFLDTVSIDIIGKDPIAADVKIGRSVDVSPAEWADAYNRVVKHTRLPLLSWNWASFSCVARATKNRVIITGTGADELFGGYPYNVRYESSPYSASLGLRLIDHVKQNSLLADYVVQSGGVDLLGADLVAGMHGKESRTPFAHQRMIKFALSLPYEYKVSKTTPKAILHALYQRRTKTMKPAIKQGFAGHCNDSMSMIWPGYQSAGLERLAEWRRFIQQDFLRRYAA